MEEPLRPLVFTKFVSSVIGDGEVQRGDVVEVEVDAIGSLRNPVRELGR